MDVTSIMGSYVDFAQKAVTSLDCIAPAAKLNKRYQSQARALDKAFGSTMNGETSRQVKEALVQKSKNINTYTREEATAKAALADAIKKAQKEYAARELRARVSHQKEEKRVQGIIDSRIGNALKERAAKLQKINVEIQRYYMPWVNGCRASRKELQDTPLVTAPKEGTTPAFTAELDLFNKICKKTDEKRCNMMKKEKTGIIAYLKKHDFVKALKGL